MSAEVLREAARLMRERATDAADAWGSGSWHHDGLGYNDAHGMVYDVKDAQGAHLADADCEELAVHIASWHPAVALAVADWLDNSADHEVSGYALAVARAYLGDPS